MNINILKSTDYIQKQLFLNKTGTVHSVYQKTINIRMGTMLFALQSCGSPVSPVSMICNLSEEDFSSLHIQVNDSVSVSEDKFFIQSADLLYCFHFSGCQVLTVHPWTPLPSAHAELIQMAIDHSHTGGFRNLFASSISAVPDPEFLILPAVRTILDECRDLVTKKSYPDAAICLSRLIGIGIELTPSGDDFLCGILAGFPLWNAVSHPLFYGYKNFFLTVWHEPMTSAAHFYAVLWMAISVKPSSIWPTAFQKKRYCKVLKPSVILPAWTL